MGATVTAGFTQLWACPSPPHTQTNTHTKDTHNDTHTHTHRQVDKRRGSYRSNFFSCLIYWFIDKLTESVWERERDGDRDAELSTVARLSVCKITYQDSQEKGENPLPPPPEAPLNHTNDGWWRLTFSWHSFIIGGKTRSKGESSWGWMPHRRRCLLSIHLPQQQNNLLHGLASTWHLPDIDRCRNCVCCSCTFFPKTASSSPPAVLEVDSSPSFLQSFSRNYCRWLASLSAVSVSYLHSSGVCPDICVLIGETCVSWCAGISLPVCETHLSSGLFAILTI